MAERCPVLPDDVIEEILAWLPAKLVLRCRRLSRAWATRLSSDGFADRHLRLANRQGGPRILLLQWSESAGPKAHMWSPDHPGGATLMNLPRDRFPYNPTQPHNGVQRVGTIPRLVTQQCRGLVILDAAAAGIQYVCNPSTGQMTALPEGRPTGYRVPTDWTHKYASLGLGYDMHARRHKVVRICYRGCDAQNLPATSAACEVYVVNSMDGQWRPAKSEHPRPPGWVNRYKTSVYAQGHVYWLTQRKPDSQSPQEMLIVSFSLADETFGTVPPPLGVRDKSVLERHLTVLDGRLCFFCNVRPRYDVYLLRQGGACWDQHCRINTTPEVKNLLPYVFDLHPLAIIDNGRRILLIQPRPPVYSRAASFRLCAYAPTTGHNQNLLDDSGLVSHPSMTLCHSALYEESVVSTGQPYEDIVFPMSLVLRRLPEHTLRGLVCVCRSWRTMIKSHRFAQQRYVIQKLQ